MKRKDIYIIEVLHEFVNINETYFTIHFTNASRNSSEYVIDIHKGSIQDTSFDQIIKDSSYIGIEQKYPNNLNNFLKCVVLKHYTKPYRKDIDYSSIYINTAKSSKEGYVLSGGRRSSFMKSAFFAHMYGSSGKLETILNEF